MIFPAVYEYAPETCAQVIMRVMECLVRAEYAVSQFQWPEASHYLVDAARCADKLNEYGLQAQIRDFHAKCFADKEINHEAAVRGIAMLRVAAYEVARESNTRYVPVGANGA